MFRRHLSTFLLVIYSLFSLACLSWSADDFVRTLKHALSYLVSPANTAVSSEMDKWGSVGLHVSHLIRLDRNYRELEELWRRHRLEEKRFRELEKENERLTDLLGLRPLPRYKTLAARVWARDPNDWFHSIVINRGREHGVRVSDAVITVQGGMEILVGQVIEVFPRTAQVLLKTDPISAVSARVSRTGEHGAVEGQGTNRLVLNYLLSESDVQLGDEVVTAGLGEILPEGMVLGHVDAIEPSSRASFKRVFLRSALRLNKLQEVLVLMKDRRGEEGT